MSFRFSGSRFGSNAGQGGNPTFQQAAMNAHVPKPTTLPLTHDTALKDLKDPVTTGNRLIANGIDVRSTIEKINEQLQIQDNLINQLNKLAVPDFSSVQIQREKVLQNAANLAATQKEVRDINLKPLIAEKDRIQYGVDTTFSRARIISSAIDDSNMMGTSSGFSNGRRGGSIHSDVPFPSPVLTHWLKSAETRKDELYTLLDQTEAAVSQMGSLLDSGGAVDPQVEEEMLKQILHFLGQSIIRIASESIDPMATEVSKLRDAVNELRIHIPTESANVPKSTSLSSSSSTFSSRHEPKDIFEWDERKTRNEQDNAEKEKEDKLKNSLQPPPPPLFQVVNGSVLSSSSVSSTGSTTNVPRFGVGSNNTGQGRVFGAQTTNTSTSSTSGNFGSVPFGSRVSTAAPVDNQQQQGNNQQQQQQQQQQGNDQQQQPPRVFGTRQNTAGVGAKFSFGRK